jgi:hypothetical protein
MAGSHLSVSLPQRTPNPSLHHNSLQHFDPCTYRSSNLASFVNSFLRNAIPALSIGGVSAVLRHLQKPPIHFLLPLLVTIGSRFQFRAVGRAYLPQGTTPQGGFSPCHVKIPADVSYVFPHSVPPSLSCMYPSHRWTPVNLKSAATRNLLTVFICHILT